MQHIHAALQNYRVVYEIIHNADQLDALYMAIIEMLECSVKEWITSVPPFIFSDPYLDGLLSGVSAKMKRNFVAFFPTQSFTFSDEGDASVRPQVGDRNTSQTIL